MKIDSLDLQKVCIPLKFQFSQSNNTTSQSLSAILAVHTASGITGFGEACPRPYVTGETIGSMRADLEKLLPELKTNPIASPADLWGKLQNWEKKGIGSSTRCALEMAILSAWSQEQQKSLAEILDITEPKTLYYSLVLPLLRSEELEKLLPALRDFRPPSIKLKVDNDLPKTIANLQLIRSFFGSETPIRVDVNGGWNLTESQKFIPELLKQGMQSFEDPLPPGQLDDMAVLTLEFGATARIMADESLTSLERARYLIEKKGCNHFNLKLSKLGGIFATLAVYQLAEANGFPCQLGAHFGETSILSSAGIIFASLAGPMTAYEGALGEFLLLEDLTRPPIQMGLNGELDTAPILNRVIPSGEIDSERLEKYTVERPV